MRTTQQLSITLPIEMAEAVESWLLNQVGPAFDAMQANPDRALSADQLRAKLATLHQSRNGN